MARGELPQAHHRAHVRHLETRADPAAERLCPRCASPLVLRTLKTGPRSGERFWGLGVSAVSVYAAGGMSRVRGLIWSVIDFTIFRPPPSVKAVGDRSRDATTQLAGS